MSRFELLAPAGSLAALKAAVNAGADAVYIGGAKFGARAYADNPPCDELIQGINFCHLRNRRVYLTVNTLFKNAELYDELFDYLKPYYEAGLDAVIVQDIGAAEFISKNFKGLDIHISTQAAITMAEGAKLLCERIDGITRVVPARELSLTELKRFREDSKLEIEVFVHGALCYCYSGQCLLSSMIGGRSGNRGRCAQPCRKLYDGRYLLSPKDQCLLPVIHELMDIGIDSFKIEGRMKSPEYTAGVVSVYRKYIDLYEKLGSNAYRSYIKDNQKQLNKDIDILKDLYNRGGFNSGYLFSHNGPDMMSFERPNHSGVLVGEVINTRGREAIIKFTNSVNAQDVLEIRDSNCKVFEFTLGSGYDSGENFGCITMKGKNASKGMQVYRTKNSELNSYIDETYVNNNSKVPIKAEFEAHVGSKYSLKLSTGVTCVAVQGDITEAAGNAPATEESLTKQLSKLGETDFIYDGRIKFDIDSNVFIPSSKLNELRRKAVCELEEAIVGKYKRSTIVEQPFEKNISSVAAPYADVYSVWNISQLERVIHNTDEGEIYYNLTSLDISIIKDVISLAGEHKVYFGLPYVSRAAVYDRIVELLEAVKREGLDVAFLVRTREEEMAVSKSGLNYRTDYNLYVMNNSSAKLSKAGYTISTELNREEIKELDLSDGDFIVYGYQPVMISAQCVYKNKFGKCRDRSLDDFVTVTDELSHDFRCRQLCSFCTNIIYNSAKLNLEADKEELIDMGIKRFRYEFTFETEDDIDMFFKDRSARNSEHFTNGHYQRGVQ